MADHAATSNITSILREQRVFPPPKEFAANAHVRSMAEYENLWQRAKDDPEGFWAEQAQLLDWFEPFQKVLEWKEPFAKWFVGGKINVSYNCLDRHLSTARRNKAALVEGRSAGRQAGDGFGGAACRGERETGRVAGLRPGTVARVVQR